MKISLFTLVIISSGVLIQCGSSFTTKDEADLQNQDAPNRINYTKSELEGDWTLIHVETIKEKQSIARFKAEGGDVVQEWTPPVHLNNDSILVPYFDDFYSISNRDLHIRGDSIYWLDYPLQLEQRRFYTIESDQLKLENDPNVRQVVLSPDRDTISFMGDYGLYIKETYEKVTFDDSILNILKLYHTNFPLLTGTWEIVREAGDEYGDQYTLYFPYTIPDSVVITEKELISTLYADRSCRMMTNGKKEKYFMGYYDREILLTPDSNWCNPDDWPSEWHNVDVGSWRIRLWRMSKERQQVSPQKCWAEFLQVITSGNIHETIDLMTYEGFQGLRKNRVHDSKLELRLKRLGRAWQSREIQFDEIQKDHAMAKLGPGGNETQIAFVKENGLWKIDALTFEE